MKKKYTVTDRLITRITGWMSGIIIVALAIWGVFTLWGYYNYEQTNDAQIEEYINPVISRAGGFIVAVNFEENQHVAKGDTLLIIDNREYLLQQEQTEAAIQKSRAQLQVLESNMRTLEKNAAAARAQITATKAKLWKEQLEYDRYHQLYTEESATKQQLENIQVKLDVVTSNLQSAQNNYDAAISRIEAVKAEKAVVLAETARLNALLNRHRLDVSYTVIRAAYNGRMGRRTVEVGQMINAGEPLAFIVNNETDKWVVANFKETQVAHMQTGDSVKVIADAYPGREFKGTVISFSPATGSRFSLLPPDNATGNFVKIVQRIPVRIRIDGNRKELDILKVGMNVNVYIPKRQRHE